jgi:hypothetical protein
MPKPRIAAVVVIVVVIVVVVGCGALPTAAPEEA